MQKTSEGLLSQWHFQRQTARCRCPCSQRQCINHTPSAFEEQQCYALLLTLETQQAISEELGGGDSAQPWTECLMLQMKVDVMHQEMQEGGL